MLYSLKQLIYSFCEWKRMWKISKAPEFEKERQKSRIIRLIHSIEKGMCLDEPRLGFGITKLNKLLSEAKVYEKNYGSDEFCLKMTVDVISDYLRFHEEKQYTNADIEAINISYSDLKAIVSPSDRKAGGFQHIAVLPNTYEGISKLLLNRHSVREFRKDPVREDDIVDAVRAAQYGPSACNRQGYRAYVIPSKKLTDLYNGNLTGIGGFADSADRFILITGKISSYDFSEYNQYIVSASIFASYLSLALLEKNIGSCIVQRPLRDSKQNHLIMNYCNIPKDEQIVLMMAIGNLKSEFNAPVSGRFPVEEILTFVQ